MNQMWSEMSRSKRLSFVIFLGLLVGITIWGIFYVTKSRYQLLVDLSPATFADVISNAEKDLLDYQIDEQGRVLVNERDFSKAQMLIQQTAKPAFNSHGLELYDSVDYSMTEHTQKVTYQRALQGELERTLSALVFIEQARVHLSFAERKLFSAEQQKAKAAVTLFSPQPLSLQQIQGVQQLVAAAVDGLSAADVTILGGEGQILSRSDDAISPGVVGFSPQESIEQRLEQKAAKVLQMFFAETDFAVSISVELDYSQRTAVSQHILPLADGKGAIKQQRQTTNQQPVKADGVVTMNQNTETEYLHGTRTEEVKEASGKIQRISLAAVIQAAVDEQRLSQLTALLVAATGMNEARGDSISINTVAPATAGKHMLILPDTSNQIVPAPARLTPASTEVRAVQSVGASWWWLLVPVLLLSSWLLYLSLSKRRQQHRQMTLLQVQQWLKDGQHAL